MKIQLFNKSLTFYSGIILFSVFSLAWITVSDYDFGNLKNKSYYKTLFSDADRLKLADADDFYIKGKADMLEAEKYFRKADGFKKVAENYGGKTLKKAKKYEKRGTKSALKAYENFFKASDIKFRTYSDKLKNMNSDNSKKHLKAEEISINARAIYIEGNEMKAKAEKLSGKNKVDALKLAFDKHLEAIHNQEIAFAIYMNDPDIIYDERKDEVIDVTKTKKEDNTQPETNENDTKEIKETITENKTENNYSPENDPNIYESKEDLIIGKLNMSDEDISLLADAKDKKNYADNIMKDVDNDYSKIDKIRTEAELAEDEYEKDMKSKMASGLEEVLFEKMIKAADLYFNANKTKYEVYAKYLPKAKTSDKINEAKKHEINAEKFHSDALKTYHKANFYSGHKSNKYIQIMDAVQTELSAVQEQENAFSIYFDKPVKKTDIVDNNVKTNDNSVSEGLKYNYAGSFVYSKYNPKPVPLKAKKGIIFKVQVGLFKGLLPLKTYGKYSPISFDTFKNNPYRRFFLGEYRSYKAAEYVLNKIKRKGLTDPFIVAFENGVKKSATYGISKIVRTDEFEKTEAREMSLLTGKAYENNNIENNNIQNNNINTSGTGIKEISEFNGLVYCVQLGNFSSPKQKSDFPGVPNIIYENNKSTHKYLSGPYSTYEEAKKAGNMLKNKGYEGVFTVAYNHGKRISLSQAAEIKKSENKNSINTADKDNIWFSVQIGAFSHRLNDAEMQEFGELNDKYTINVKQLDGGLFLYTIGKFKTYKEAANLKKEIKTMNFDGFVIAFKGGIKISAAEAIEILKNK